MGQNCRIALHLGARILESNGVDDNATLVGQIREAARGPEGSEESDGERVGF